MLSTWTTTIVGEPEAGSQQTYTHWLAINYMNPSDLNAVSNLMFQFLPACFRP